VIAYAQVNPDYPKRPDPLGPCSRSGHLRPYGISRASSGAGTRYALEPDPAAPKLDRTGSREGAPDLTDPKLSAATYRSGDCL
jgi:hypothetical protein